jgi:hypothetical protein
MPCAKSPYAFSRFGDEREGTDVIEPGELRRALFRSNPSCCGLLFITKASRACDLRGKRQQLYAHRACRFLGAIYSVLAMRFLVMQTCEKESGIGTKGHTSHSKTTPARVFSSLEANTNGIGQREPPEYFWNSIFENGSGLSAPAWPSSDCGLPQNKQQVGVVTRRRSPQSRCFEVGGLRFGVPRRGARSPHDQSK